MELIACNQKNGCLQVLGPKASCLLIEEIGKVQGQLLADGKIKIGDKWYASIDDYINNNPIETGIEINPTEITLKKKETGAEGTEVLTGTITASVFGMESEPEITWEKSSNGITLSSTKGKSITVGVVETQTEALEATVIAKCTYDGKGYSAKCKVTLEIIEKEEPKITVSEMQGNNLSTYLGQTVNYGVTYDDKSANGYGQGKCERIWKRYSLKQKMLM